MKVQWQNKGVEAVIDKDFSAATLACILEADILLILTTVERVCLNFNKKNQQEICSMSVREANRYIKEGQFAPGSMLPKIQAALKFVEQSKPSSKLIITSIDKAKDALNGLTGTSIRKWEKEAQFIFSNFFKFYNRDFKFDFQKL